MWTLKRIEKIYKPDAKFPATMALCQQHLNVVFFLLRRLKEEKRWAVSRERSLHEYMQRISVKENPK